MSIRDGDSMASLLRVCLRIGFFAVAVALVGLTLASCDGSDPPTSPPPPGGGSPTPIVVLRIEITAPEEIAPGQSVQLSAQAVKSDGSREDVTGRARWTTAATDVLDLGAAGLASGKQPGEALIGATMDAFSATVRVFVLPPGTYRLSGKTHEFGTPLPDVSIEVLEGVGAGLKTLSRADGTYALYGVSGPVRLHLKKTGFINATQNFMVSSHLTRDLGLESETGYEPLTGTYTLTVTAVSPCSGSFPDAARRRTYTAHMRQNRTSLTVSLVDADFILTRGYGNGFTGYSDRTGIHFDLSKGDFYYYYYSKPEYQLVERLTSNSAVVVHGMGEASGPASHLRGRLGTISVTTRLAAPHTPFAASCNADFEMVRR